MGNMKIAILYSGFVRNLPETISNNLSCFDYADIDLYFSLWNKVGYTDQINAPDNIVAKRILEKDIEITEEVVKNIVPTNVAVKKIKIEEYSSNKCHFSLINGLDRNGLGQQFYKVLDCFNLLDNSINYDAIIRLRCDMLLHNNINQNYLKQLVDDQKIIFASKIWYDYSWKPGIKNINDMLWISNFELMKKACNIYNNTDKINTIILNRKQNILNHGENICYMNLEAENIIYNITTFDFNYNILR